MQDNWADWDGDDVVELTDPDVYEDRWETT